MVVVLVSQLPPQAPMTQIKSVQSDVHFRRARPLLGTIVDIRVDDLDAATANAAINRGFAAVAEVHRLMSFHEAASDVSRLNREAAQRSVAVDALTFEVLRCAQEMSEASDGLFDITVAHTLSAWGFLPLPDGASPDPHTTWRDIVLRDGHVRFLRPLWIDLGGIAKGFAVDRAVAAMNLDSTIQQCVNAGGDLRVAGPRTERIHLQVPANASMAPVIELENGSLASSSGQEHSRMYEGRLVGPHVHTPDGTPTGLDTFVSVAAPDCIVADALTKVALACGKKSEPLLRQYGATAYIYDGDWTVVGASA